MGHQMELQFSKLEWNDSINIRYKYEIDELDNGYTVKIWKTFYSLTGESLVPKLSLFVTSFEDAIQVIYNYRAKETKSELEK